jgi:hypothetical protein
MTSKGDSMPQHAEYKIFTGNTRDVQQQLAVLGMENWKPILLSAVPTQGGVVSITVIFEHVMGS